MDKPGKLLLTKRKGSLALRKEVFAKGVVVKDLKDDKGAFNGMSVTWADEHYWRSPVLLGLASIALLFLALLLAVAASKVNIGPLSFILGLIAFCFVIVVLRGWMRQNNAREFDTLRSLVIRPDGRLETPLGLPDYPDVTWLHANYANVTGIQLSAEQEWFPDRRSGQKSYIVLQTEAGQPVFLGYSPRSKAELQPVIVALHNTWERMRPFVTAHRAVAAGQPAGPGAPITINLDDYA